ncbi:MAG: AarF/ABC1/UbiB kinase family protein [Saprospirales bacterium]|nr:MAG: AarF/ABC1/UbiB kinase family protein [Saprospirales bacterium]
MGIIPDSIDRYVKFIRFVVNHWNSDIFSHGANRVVAGEMESDGQGVDYEKPKELAEDLKSMGPTFVKLGQLLSTRPDLLPDHYLDALSELQDDVDSIPFEDVREIVEEEIGMRISKAFKSFDENPLGSASIGQVHKAELHDDRKVAVKIRRPGIKKSFLEDLDTLKEVANIAVKHIGAARKYALDEVLEEFRFMLINELDCNREAENLIALGANLKSFKNLFVPQPVNDFSSSRILTMDYVDGKKVTDLGPMKMLETDFTDVVNELVEAYLKQIVLDGFAHADPHPGNIHLTKNNQLALMDLGMVARFSGQIQESILKLMVAISQYDGGEVANALLEMSRYDESADIDAFNKKITRLVLDNQNRKVKDMQTGRLIIQMNRIAANSGIKIAVELNILGKILLNMDKIVSTLSPNYDLQETISTNVERMMMEKVKSELKPRNFFSRALEAKRLAENLPERLNTISQNLAENKFEIKVKAIDEQSLTSGFQKVANRITLGLIIASLIIGAALLMRVPTSFTILGYPGIPILLFLFAGIIGMALIVNIIRKDDDF